MLGILDHVLTAHFSIAVDKRSGELILAPGRATVRGGVEPIAVRTVADRDRIDALVDGKPLTLTLDLGATSGLSLMPAAWARVKPKDAQQFERKAVGGSGIVDTQVASRLPALTLGGTVVRDLDVRVSPQLDTEHGQLWLIPVTTDASKLTPPKVQPAR